MVARSTTFAALVPLLAASLAGCLDPEGGANAFDALEAPTWQAGYSWTYDVTSSYHSTYAERGRPGADSETEQDAFTLSVVNDTLDFQGEPSYLLRSSKNVDHPFLQGSLQAITKANLAVAGFGYHYENHYPTRAPRAVSASSVYYPPQPKDPCEGVMRMNAVPADQRFPAVQFPLDDGQAWTGTWGPEDDMQFTYTARVRGMTPVHVPAGVFPSVYIEATFSPVIPEDVQYEMPFQFRVRSESWYSPDVRYLTKMVVSAEASGSPHEGYGPVSFDYVSTMVLRSFDLSAKESAPVQIVVQKPYDDHVQAERHYGFQIVADQKLPIEVGNGPVTVNLGLESMTDYHDYDGRIKSRPGALPETADIDHSTHEVVWMVGRYGDWNWNWQETVGDTLALTLEEGGRYAVHAHVRPLTCGDYSRSQVSGDLTTTVTRTFDLKVDPGVARSIKMGTFAVEPEGSMMEVQWSMVPTAGVALDRGRPVLISPSNERRELPASPHKQYSMYPEGDWSLEWRADQPTIGDDVKLTVKLWYDPWHAG